MEISFFLQLVADELNNIRTKATKSELSNLNVSRFHPTLSSDCCIYGQLTGSYTSSRASEITKKSFHSIQCNFRFEEFKKGTTFTALEKYMSYHREVEFEQVRIQNDEVREVMEYLQGKRSSLKLSLLGETYYVNHYGSSNVNKGVEIIEVKEIQI